MGERDSLKAGMARVLGSAGADVADLIADYVDGRKSGVTLRAKRLALESTPVDAETIADARAGYRAAAAARARKAAGR